MAREMKDSGVKWIGEIPGHWEVKRLKNLFILKTGTTPKNYENGVDTDRLVNWFTPADVAEMNCELKESQRYLSKTVVDNERIRLYPQGSLIFVAIGASAGKIGYAQIEGYSNQQITALIPKENCYSKYSYYCMLVDRKRIRDNALYTTLPIINNAYLSSIKTLVPPLSEQQAIADFLDAKCAEIDGLLADLDAEVKTLAEYKKSIIAETVTRGLNPNVPMKPSGIPWAEMIPAHWEMFRLRFVVQIVSGYKNSSSIKVGLENIESWTGKYIPSETEFEGKGNYFGNNDILFGKLRPYLAKVYLAEFEGQAIGDFLVFRTKECAVPKYVKYFLLNPLVIGLINGFTYGAKMPRANWQDISKVFMPIPPIEEQEAIAAYLDEKCAAIDQAITDKQTQIETLKSYKASLIYEYVTGKKQVI